jgi:hypothetical protein
MPHPWHDVPIEEEAPEELTALIEIPKGSRVKYGNWFRPRASLLLHGVVDRDSFKGHSGASCQAADAVHVQAPSIYVQRNPCCSADAELSTHWQHPRVASPPSGMPAGVLVVLPGFLPDIHTPVLRIPHMHVLAVVR